MKRGENIMKQITLEWLDYPKKNFRVREISKNKCIINRGNAGKPIISIVVAHYNRAIHMSYLIDSICRQEFKLPVELIIVDDCSKKEDLQKLGQYKDIANIYSLVKNSGSEALPQNIGINLARGKYVAFIDSDDYLLSKKSIDIMYRSMQKNPDAKMGISNVIFIIETDKVKNMKWVMPGQGKIKPYDVDEELDKLYYRDKIEILTKRKSQKYSIWDLMLYSYHIGFRFFRRDSLINKGGWPIELKHNDDFGIVLKYAMEEYLTQKEIILPIDCDAYAYRITGDNVSIVDKEMTEKKRDFVIDIISKLKVKYNELLSIASEQSQKKNVSFIEKWDLEKELIS